MKKILITGANSYIGTSLEKWLGQWKESYQVTTLDMLKPEWREYNFAQYDVIFHVAGIAHADVGKVTEEQKKLYYKVNCDLAVETALKAKMAGVCQFILMSSMIVYGGVEHVSKNTLPAPSNFYGDSKWQADQKVRQLADSNFKIAVLRPPMIYGKGSKGNYPVLSKLAQKSPIFPGINNKRSMLYIDNLCEFVRVVIDKQAEGVFFPQNAQLVNTSNMVKEIARVHRHKIWVSRLLSPFVVLGKCVPGKIGNLCKKAFGDSYYDLSMSSFELQYHVANLQDSIRKTEE